MIKPKVILGKIAVLSPKKGFQEVCVERKEGRALIKVATQPNTLA